MSDRSFCYENSLFDEGLGGQKKSFHHLKPFWKFTDYILNQKWFWKSFGIWKWFWKFFVIRIQFWNCFQTIEVYRPVHPNLENWKTYYFIFSTKIKIPIIENLKIVNCKNLMTYTSIVWKQFQNWIKITKNF